MTTARMTKPAPDEQVARIGKALASPRRIELLDLLAQGEHSVEVLAAETDMSVTLTSAHLRALRQARLVETRRIEIAHELEGAGLDVAPARRAVERSSTRYCTASAMFSAGPADIRHRYLIRRAEDPPEESGEVVVTGPGDDPDALGERWSAAAQPPAGVARC